MTTATALAPPERYSMSFVRASEECLRRAHHDREVDIDSVPSLIGSIFHEIAATVGLGVTMRGETTVEVAEALRIAEQVIRNPEEPSPLPEEVWAEVRNLVGRWARSVSFLPGEQFELDYRTDLEGRTLSARIDRLWIDGSKAWVRDYKTGWGEPPTKLPLQGKVYGWHVLTTHPEVERVSYTEDRPRFDAPPATFEIHREDLAEIEAYLLDAIARIESAYGDEDLDPSPGSACMAFGRPCPVAESCPAPERAKVAASITTEAEAREQAEALFVEEARIKQRTDALRGYIEGAGVRAVSVGGREIGFAPKAGESFAKARLLADLAERGVDVDPADYVTTKAPSFGRRKAQG